MHYYSHMTKQHTDSSVEKLLRNIERLLAVRGWDIAEYARKCKPLNSRSVYHYMNRERSPGLDSLDALAKPFGLTGSQLISDLDDATLKRVEEEIDTEYKELVLAMSDTEKSELKQFGKYLLARREPSAER